MKTTAIFTAAALLTAGTVQAATIIWGGATDISSSNDVLAAGTLVEAVNASAAGSPSPVVNGVPFTSGSLLSSNNGVDVFLGSTGDSAYDTLLSNVDFGSESSITIGGGSLVSGRPYLIQVWYADDRNATIAARNMTFGDGELIESTVSLNAGSAQYAVGLFTADGTGQTLTITGDDGSGGSVSAHINGYQLRDLTSATAESASHDFYHNLAKYQTVTADSSASDKPVQFANDGFASQDNRWVSSGSGPHWLKIELAVPMTVGSAHLYSGGTWNSAMSDIVLQYEDDGSWVDIAGTDISGNTLSVLNLPFNAPVTAKTFRLYTADGTARVEELALYPPTTDGSNVAFGVDVDLSNAKLRQYAYSSVDGANYPKLAIDGYADNSSAWASINSAGPHDLEIHLPQGEKIRGFQLYSGWEGLAGTQVRDFEVAYYDSSTSNWVNFAGGAVTNNAEQNLNVRFDAAATSTKFRFRSLDVGQTVVRELVLLPEDGAAGFPLWTDVLDEAPPARHFMEYEDDYYTLENRSNGWNLTTSTSGSTTVTNEPEFQVLYNFGTDTFRLRSKETERCFEVLNASTNVGAAIVEGTYSTMPHQRWRLEDAGDGEHVRIVNVWSGLVLGLDGTNVVQVADGSEFSKHWKINLATPFPKKGQASHFHFSQMFNPSWAYRWTYVDEDDLGTGQYMPMQWGGAGASALGIQEYQPAWYQRANQTTVMGFNEPDLHDQANLEVETAAYQWPRLERMKLPLLGPCPAGYKNYWRTGYEALAAEEGLRSEYMAMHWYSIAGASSGSPGTLISNMQTLYDLYGKPIWLTEFSTRDFVGDKTTWSRNHNFNFLAEFMWRAETLPWLKKWSLFEWGYGGNPDTSDANSENPTDMNSPKLALHYSNDSSDPGWEDLMECGLLLAGWDGNTNTVDETAYIIHNKARYLRLIDHPDNATVTTADVEHRLATEQFMLETAPNGKKYITGLSDGRRLSCDGSSVGLAAAGTTGTTVEWELTDYQYGWVYIDHPSTGKRLRISDANAIDVVADTTANNNVRFRFIKHYNPITLTTVQTLPYAESFENGVGAWREFDTVYNNGDARFWEIGTGGTPTAAAGPSGASDGEYYLFAEGHDAGSYATNSVHCTFDLSAEDSAMMTFDYHMYGSYIAFLAVDIHDGTSWTLDVWKKTNQQQTSSSDPWLSAIIDLTAYAGNAEVTIRFRTANKQWNAADPAIDNIRIAGPDAVPQQLPYAESFESGFGAWTQSADDDFDWTRHSGYTDTTNTGPSAASDGTWYLYIEGHDNYNGHNKVARLECVFDFSTATHPELLFDYHMFGINIDYLAVDVSDGTSWTSNVWMHSGAVQTSSESAWSNAVVDLSAYAGNDEVTLRFRAKQGYWHVSDVAIDNLFVQDHVFTPYELWALTTFAGAPGGTDTSESGNPDGDRFSNLQEWALVLDPLTADLPPMNISINDPNFFVTYDRRIGSGLTVRAGWATSVTSTVWRLNGDGLTEVSIGSTDDVETIAAFVPLDGTNKFIRVEVEE